MLRPSLPTIDRVLPFLRRIDETRIYSNQGPLWTAFRDGFARWLGLRAGVRGVHVVPTSSGTTAIEVALRLRAAAGRHLCLMPSFTFIASAHAVCNAGLTPFLVDVDAESLVLTPVLAERAMRRMAMPPAAVLVVSAFGAPPDVEAWEAFEREHGVPVVFDAAAAATSLRRIGRQPLCVSLHATKVFGIGEGGAVITTDRDMAARIESMIGFGFSGSSRQSDLRGGNYRISEYTAAMGLAVLAEVDAKEAALRRLGRDYAGALAGSCARLQQPSGGDWATMTFNVTLPRAELQTRLDRLDAGGVGWRRWWGLGTHRHAAFADLPRDDLSVTDDIAPRVIGLPFLVDLTPAQLARVAACLA
ncbi:DegT/DnrJ/EryC1/StrS family aminotransferase [Paeniroseomonas aquatica]|uniref:DegT/DnrJ/EryC1/StrS family aminotransferase n=1 Tax=Paeniroseomonas aquatica TaxID=373043 RepID=A0ABT8ABI6_9PROT|nr:DegT/DnrJ/EryC1/StrS family aminotransferase [Paeniroseomonas aquatica]MDN3567126.1 DegT/DnrJ/EryC1/StrS family aminotransferase [Paeniroseomonas aquatica]